MSNLNADQGELSKFSELAHRWWDPKSEFQPLHEINPLRLDWIDTQSTLSGKTVLDVGCGGGILSESMAARHACVTGIDLSEKALSVAKLHLYESQLAVEYQLIAVEQLASERPGTFDVITCMEMLEHVPDPASVVKACATLVKPGGSVYFSTLNRNIKAYLMAVIGAEYIMKLLPRGTHDYEKFITPSELSRMVRQSGLMLSNASGIHYNPLSKEYSLARDASVNYMFKTIRPI